MHYHATRDGLVPRTLTQGGAKSDISSSSTSSSGVSNTWRRRPTKRKPRHKTPPSLPTPDPIERFVYLG